MGYLTLTKYPPSMAFIALTMGVNLLLLFGISQMKNQNNVATKLLSGFGRVPFFFYILHLAFFTLVGTFTLYFTITYPLLYLFWLLSLALLYPVCIWFGKLKAKAPPQALIRFF